VPATLTRELGWAGATLTVVAEGTGMSRGAVLADELQRAAPPPEPSLPLLEGTGTDLRSACYRHNVVAGNNDADGHGERDGT
jgi:hypothetical protein